MKKVAIITNYPSPYRVDLFDYMIEHYPEYEFHIIYSLKKSNLREWESEGEFRNSTFLKNKKITVKTRYDARDIIFTLGLNKELKRIKPNIIVATEYNITTQKALSYAKRHKIPFVSWSDATKISERDISKLQMRLRKRVVKHANAFIASSTRARELQIEYGAPADRVFVSLLTVDTKKYEVIKEDYPKSIIYVGTNAKRKGLDLLISALSRVGEDYTLEIIGCKSLDGEAAELASSTGVAERINFHGFISPDEIKEFYKRGGIFVLPTREDCFALVILEAMCASLPVLVSKYADGAYDLMRDGENGYLFDPYDADGTAEKINALLSDEKMRRKFGECSHELSKSFGLAPSANDFMRTVDFALKGEKK